MTREPSATTTDATAEPVAIARPVVAFVCTHNACRSQMAQALAERMMPGEATFLSAGTDPASHVDAGALEELSRRGIPPEIIVTLRPKYLSELPTRVDWLVTMGCGVACPMLPCAHREDWGLKDPTGGPKEHYAACAEDILLRLADLRVRMGIEKTGHMHKGDADERD